jgi:O-acetyl-ADP-ribose deacetylase (regulator of RNase III)
MSVEIKRGNIFTSQAQTLVNTVNCVGVMGAGIALECRLRYPHMFEVYQGYCTKGEMTPGKLSLYKGSRKNNGDIDDKWVLNFPTKVHWKFPSKMEWIVQGLDKFVAVYQAKGITSIAFPVLGSLNGGLNSDDVLDVMQKKLSVCEIPIEIYQYQADAPDDLYNDFKAYFQTHADTIGEETGIRRDRLAKVSAALESPEICQLNQLAKVKGIGVVTLEKVFSIMRHPGGRVEQGYLSLA